jgi:hypothetical protein
MLKADISDLDVQVGKESSEAASLDVARRRRRA